MGKESEVFRLKEAEPKKRKDRQEREDLAMLLGMTG
jgi:hypothetical protein